MDLFLCGEGRASEILKWLRAQNPPCPWSKSDSRKDASLFGHQHIIKWIDQQEDESDAED